MAVSILDQYDYRGKKQNFKRDAFDTITDMVAFSDNYLPPIFEAYCYEDGNKYRYRETNDIDPVTGKWRVVTEGGMSDLPTASAAVKGGVKIGENLTMTGEVLSADKQTEEDFTTELKEKLEGIDMSTKVDVEEGKGLSTNDFTDELKAQYDKAEENVQSDWKETDDTLDSFIKGKPTKLSDFENDPEFITKAVENLENYYKKSETYTQAEINALLQAINQFNVYLVDVLPELDIDDHAIYFCKKEGAVSDFYEQYIYVQEVWRKIGDTQISLDDYYTKTEADDLLDKKADQETTYTKTETNELLDDKQDVLEFDDEPTEGSDNPVTSTGVKAYVDTEVEKKLDKSFGEENKNKTLKTDENGDVVLIDVSSLPEPEAKDKMFLSAENAETSELEWVQVDKGTIDGSAYVNLDIGSDLNTLITHGRYRTTTERVDRIANVPVQVAGMLTVRLTGSVIYQTYRTVDNEMYIRTSEDAGENWCEWIEVGASSDVENIYTNKFASKNIFKPMGLCNISSADATVVPAQSAYGYCAEVDTTKSYTISFEGEGTCAYAFFAKYPEIGDVAIGGVRYNIEGLSAVIKSADFPEGTKYVMIRTADTVSKVQLEIGETATSYAPFLKSNKMLAEEFDNLKKESVDRVALTELKMLGWCVPKEFNGIKNEVVDGKFIQKIGRVNLGALNWYSQEVADHERFCVGSGSKEGVSDIIPSTMNIYCILYKADSAGNTYNHKTDKTISIDGNKGVRVYDSSFNVYTQLSDFVDFIQDVYMYYELESPIEIPIDGNEIILKKSGLPEPESKDKLLLSVENEETSELEWSQVDKDTVGSSPFIGTEEEWEALSLEEKAKYDGKEVIFTNGEAQLDSDKRIVICIGDSYNMNTDMWTGWGECLKTVNPNLEVYSYEAGGGGFVANTYQYDFLGALQNHSQDEEVPENKKKLVSDIVVLGGYNDCSVNATQVQITDKVKEFVGYCKKNYPNAKITIGSISFDYNSAETQGKLAAYQVYYKKAANLCGVKFYNNFTYILRNTNKIYFSDSNPNSGFHPNTAGNTSVANYLNEYLYNGGFDVKDGCLQCGAFVYSLNGNICISPTPPQGSTPEQGFMGPMLEGKTIPFNTWTDIGLTINGSGENLLWGAAPSVTAYWSVNVCKQVSGTELGFVTILICKLENKHIYVKNVANVNSIAFDGSVFLDSSSKNFYFDSQLIY